MNRLKVEALLVLLIVLFGSAACLPWLEPMLDIMVDNRMSADATIELVSEGETISRTAPAVETTRLELDRPAQWSLLVDGKVAFDSVTYAQEPGPIISVHISEIGEVRVVTVAEG